MLVTLGLWEISRTEGPESIQITTENPSAASVIENLSKFLGEPPCPSPKRCIYRRKMSQQDIQQATRRGTSTRSVLLVILLVGLGAGAVGYGLNNAFAATNPTQHSTTNGQQC